MDPVSLFAVCTLALASSPAGQSCGDTGVYTLDVTRPTATVTFGTPTGHQIGRWQSFIAEASRKFEVPQSWIRVVMRHESGGQTVLDGQPVTSATGAAGLMQVMPKTYASLQMRYGLGTNIYDPHDNIMAGAAYLREMYDRYGYPSLFAAYNAGPKRLDASLLGGKPLPSETVDYLDGILPGVGKLLNWSLEPTDSSDGRSPSQAGSRAEFNPPADLFFTKSPATNRTNSANESGAIFVQSNTHRRHRPSASKDEILVPISSLHQ